MNNIYSEKNTTETEEDKNHRISKESNKDYPYKMPPQTVPQPPFDEHDIPSLTSPCSTESSMSLNRYYQSTNASQENDDYDNEHNNNVDGSGDSAGVVEYNTTRSKNNDYSQSNQQPIASLHISNHDEYDIHYQLKQLKVTNNNYDEIENNNCLGQINVNDDDNNNNNNFSNNDNNEQNNNDNHNNITIPHHLHHPSLIQSHSSMEKRNTISNSNNKDNQTNAANIQMNQYLNHIGVKQRKVLQNFYHAAVENPCKTWKCTNPLVRRLVQ